MAYTTINFKSKEVLYAHQLNKMDQQISNNDNKVVFLDSEIKKVANQVVNIPNWAKQQNKPTYTPQEIGTYSYSEIDTKLADLTGIDLSKYYTKQEVDKLIPTDYVSNSVLDNYVLSSTLSDYVTLQELNTRDYITSYALENKNYASKQYVTDYVNKVQLEGIDLTNYPTIDDTLSIVNSQLTNYVNLDYLQENYPTKDEALQENLILEERINGLSIVSSDNGYYLQNIDNEILGDIILVPKEYNNGLQLVGNTVSLLLSEDENTKNNLEIEDGHLKFIGNGQSDINFTINNKPIQNNPVLTGNDIQMTDYEGLYIENTDTINEAFLKIEDMLTWGNLN